MTSRAKLRKQAKEIIKQERQSVRAHQLYRQSLSEQNKGGVIMDRVVSLHQHVTPQQYQFMKNWATKTAGRLENK